jgi:hypothetical protein
VDLSIGIKYTPVFERVNRIYQFTYEVKRSIQDRFCACIRAQNDNSQVGAPANNMFENFIFEYALDTNRSKYLKVYRQQNTKIYLKEK